MTATDQACQNAPQICTTQCVQISPPPRRAGRSGGCSIKPENYDQSAGRARPAKPCSAFRARRGRPIHPKRKNYQYTCCVGVSAAIAPTLPAVTGTALIVCVASGPRRAVQCRRGGDLDSTMRPRMRPPRPRPANTRVEGSKTRLPNLTFPMAHLTTMSTSTLAVVQGKRK